MMTGALVTEVDSTATELYLNDAHARVWSSPFHSATSGDHLLDASLIPRTTEISEDLCVDTSTIFTVSNAGMILTWPGRRRTHEDDVRTQVSALWAEDWDSDEDAVYDDW
jgi:hypothetical protein